jgi:ribonuclease Z
LHADHIHGLPGLLSALNESAALTLNRRKVEMFGPVGLYNYLAIVLSLSCATLDSMEIHVYELQSGVDRSRFYPEFEHPSLVRKALEQNSGGTWTIPQAVELNMPEHEGEHHARAGDWHVNAAEIRHLDRLQCLGYVFREQNDVAGSTLISATVGSLLGVSTSEGNNQVHPNEVETEEHRRPRNVTVLGDCYDVPWPMLDLSWNSDVLVHEATFSAADFDSRRSGGHSSPAMAGQVASSIEAKVLLLTHLSQAAAFRAGVQTILDEAQEAAGATTRVQMGYDHLEIRVPRNGFLHEEERNVKSTVS